MISINKFGIAAMVICSVFLLWDFSSRILQDSNAKASQVPTISTQVARAIRLRPEQQEELKALYAGFVQQADSFGGEVDSQQNIDNVSDINDDGSITRLSVSGKTLELKAIVKHQAEQGDQAVSYAVVQATEQNSRVTSIEQFLEGSEMYGYRVRIIDNKTIELIPLETSTANNKGTNNSEVKRLAMYEVRTSDSARSASN